MKIQQKNKIAVFLIGFCAICFSSISAQKATETNRWKAVFDQHNVEGTFVLQNMKTGRTEVHNLKRAETRFCPASTFKIPNSLISLQCGSVKTVHDTIRWDGKDRGVADWNKDQTMESAIKVSCVWFYQKMARRTGEAKMQEWLNKIDYGNKFIGNEVDNFWLNGDIKISAIEEVLFLKKLILQQLPFDKGVQQTVKSILLTDSAKHYKVYSKTGWSTKSTPNIGWLVGWIESKNETYIFAINIDINQPKETVLRKQISYEILKQEGIIQ